MQGRTLPSVFPVILSEAKNPYPPPPVAASGRADCPRYRQKSPDLLTFPCPDPYSLVVQRGAHCTPLLEGCGVAHTVRRCERR